MYDLHFGVMKGCPYFGWIEEEKQGRGVTFKGGDWDWLYTVVCLNFHQTHHILESVDQSYNLLAF